MIFGKCKRGRYIRTSSGNLKNNAKNAAFLARFVLFVTGIAYKSDMKTDKKTLNVHFIGVGGVSMSSLARYLLAVGFNVSGSDIAPSENLEKLAGEGVTIYIGQTAENVDGKDVVVYSDAIKPENPELKRANENKSYVLKRAELLKIVSENFSVKTGVCGCHGKTTVACMLAHVFDEANERFTAHIGGFDLKYGNCVVKGSKYFISEVCEYKKNLNFFDADYAVCLNAEADHMDCYKDRDELKSTYFDYLKRAYKAIINADDVVLAAYDGDNAVTFGLGEKCDFYAADVTQKGGKYSFDLYIYGAKSERITLKTFGGHNVYNALATAACAFLCGISPKKIKKGLENFRGAERRFEHIGNLSGAEVYADYAHHPTEIAEAIKTMKEAKKGKIYTVFQPHTFSRTIFLKDKFVKTLSETENLVLFRTYPAREEYMKGGSAKELASLLPHAGYFEDVRGLLAYLYAKVTRGDAVLVLGAGDLEEKMKKYLEK